jgi:hypothetical protein
VTTTLPLIEPLDYFRVKTVQSFAELVGTPFVDGVNAFCWPRALPGDFGEVVEKLGAGEEIVTIAEEQLAAAEVSAAGRAAIEFLREDLRRLREAERDPVLNCIHRYPRDEAPAPVRTDVFSWHVDSAPVEADTWLCTYYGCRAKDCLTRRRNGAWTILRCAPSSSSSSGWKRTTRSFAKRFTSIASTFITPPSRRRGPTRSESAICGGSRWNGRAAPSRLVSIVRQRRCRVSRRGCS